MSAIDPTKPEAGSATTASVRANFAAAKSEIEALDAGKQSILSAYSCLVPQSINGSSSRAILMPTLPVAASLNPVGLASNRLYAIPFSVPHTGTIDGLFAQVTTGVSGYCRMGIYAASTSGLLRPTTKLAETGELSTAAAAKIGAALSLAVSRGTVLFFVLHFSATPSLRCAASASMAAVFPPSTTELLAPTPGLYAASTYAALPADLSSQTWTLTGTNFPAPGITYA